MSQASHVRVVICALVGLTAASARADELKVCVEVVIRAEEPAQGKTPAKRAYPMEPTRYLKRLIEHYVTREAGFDAVEAGCVQRVTVELYPLAEGWTLFAKRSERFRSASRSA